VSDTMPPAPPAQAPRPRRNRLWLLLPAGCLGSFAFIAFIAFAGVALVMNLMKSSDAYTGAFAAAESHPAVQAALGTPIKAGFFVSGSIETSMAGGNASLAVPISGPEGSGTLMIEALMTGGVWDFQTLAVRVAATGETIDLLE
jgi:hypothetical protein